MFVWVNEHGGFSNKKWAVLPLPTEEYGDVRYGG